MRLHRAPVMLAELRNEAGSWRSVDAGDLGLTPVRRRPIAVAGEECATTARAAEKWVPEGAEQAYSSS